MAVIGWGLVWWVGLGIAVLGPAFTILWGRERRSEVQGFFLAVVTTIAILGLIIILGRNLFL